jgi:hypothetical protein
VVEFAVYPPEYTLILSLRYMHFTGFKLFISFSRGSGGNRYRSNCPGGDGTAQ